MRWTELPAPTPMTPRPSRPRLAGQPSGSRRLTPTPQCADHPWRHVVDDYYAARELAKTRRAWLAVQP
jgi:hypothetical protein